MTVARIRLLIGLACIAVLVVAIGFGAWLNIGSLKKQYTQSLVSSYAIVGGEARKQTEYAVRYGKSLVNFYGIGKVLNEVKTNAPALTNVRVVLPNGQIIQDLSGRLSGQFLNQQTTAKATFSSEDHRGYTLVKDDGRYLLFFPVRERNNAWVGSINLVFDQSLVDDTVNAYINDNLWQATITIGIAMLALLILLQFGRIFREDGTLRKNRLAAILFFVIICAQAVYSYVSVQQFKALYLAIAHDNTAISARVIQQSINSVLTKGVLYAELHGIEVWFDDMVALAPEIAHISLTFSPDSAARDAASSYTLPLRDDSSGKAGNIIVQLSLPYLANRIKEIGLDALTILVTSLFLAGELLAIAFSVMNQRIAGFAEKALRGEQSAALVRTLAFLCYIGFHMCLSFVPLQMKNLPQPAWGMPPSVVLGLPVSLEVVGISAAAFVTGFAVDSYGWRKPLLGGIALAAIGATLSGLAANGLVFSAARLVAGIGAGSALCALEAYVAVSQTGSSRVSGFSQLYAGLFAGSVCGVAVGALLAERMGYGSVFFVAGTVISCVAATAAYLSVSQSQPSLVRQPVSQSALPISTFVTNTRVLGLFMLAAIPAMIAKVGFFNYFFPIYCNELGVSPANTGRGFMLYGICFILLGPIIGKWIGQRSDLGRMVMLGCSIGAVGLLLFWWQGGLAAALFTIFLLGLSDTIASASQTGYMLSLSATQSIGNGKALSIFRMVRKAGEAVGPLLFGVSLSLGHQTGIGAAGVVYAAAIALFAISLKKN